MPAAGRDDAEKLGARVVDGSGVRFRVWAPKRRTVEVVVDREGAGSRVVTLERDREGYFSGVDPQATAGTLYRYRLDGGPSFPDPASRFQPEGVYGPSRVEDPSRFPWTDQAWRGVSIRGQVFYEMHIGTFTPEGTYAAAVAELPALAELGVTVLEVMPVNEFFGEFGWGYDGVGWFAPTRLYGEPDDLRAFVDRAHALGIGVILDVVYNHFGPEGMFWREFSDGYFSSSAGNEWGESINFDGPGSEHVREFVLQNVTHWVEEYHLDGVRIDATQALNDESAEEITLAIARVTREAAGDRRTIVVGENEPQRRDLLVPDRPGLEPLDALWNDDFHHVARAVATGRREGYIVDYRGSAREFVAAYRHGFLYQGQFNGRQSGRRGSNTRGIPREAFVVFLQNHDQVANSHRGERIRQLAAPGVYRALTAVWLLSPQTPLIFQGQEFAASSPFLYFADHEPEVRTPAREGRIEFFKQFRSLRLPETVASMAEPCDRATFERSKLNHRERTRHATDYALHRDLLKLRRDDPALGANATRGVDGAVLGDDSFVIRFEGETPEADRLLLVNLGGDRLESPPTEPLLAPPSGLGWRVLWTSEAVVYGGSGSPAPETEEGWWLQGRSAVVLAPRIDEGVATGVHEEAKSIASNDGEADDDDDDR